VADKKTIAVLGGSGALGGALAAAWERAGHEVIVGSRNPARGVPNREAAAKSDIVVLAVPYEGHAAMLADIKDAVAGKIVLDTTVPLVPPRVARVQLPAGGSAAKAAQEFLGDTVRVVSAFHAVAAHKLAEGRPVDCDVLVFGNDAKARAEVAALVADLGLKPWHGGSIDNSAAAEALTSVLIFINGRYGIDGAGFRITGTPTKSPDP
jgi:NADPH-dependent F420 reductase